MRDRLSEVLTESPAYPFVTRQLGGVSLSGDPDVPVLVSIDSPFWSARYVLAGAVHQLIAPYPLGNGAGSDGLTISETFALVAENELFRHFIETALPALLTDPFYLTEPATWFDADGRHVPPALIDLQTGTASPLAVYGANELGWAVIDLRNCTLDRGIILREFFETTRDMDTREEVYSALVACRGAFPSPTQAAVDCPPAETSVGQPAVNLIANPSFELDPATHDTRWGTQLWGHESGTSLEWTSLQARTGSHALAITLTTPGIPDREGWFTLSSIPICPGVQYEFGAWVLAPEGGQAYLVAFYVDPLGHSGTGVGTPVADLPAAESLAWEWLTLPIPPVGLQGISLRLELVSFLTSAEGAPRTVYFDDVFLGTPPEPATDGRNPYPTASSGAPSPATDGPTSVPAGGSMHLWIASQEGCLVNINGRAIGLQGPWNWDWGDGLLSTGWFPLRHRYPATGTYRVSVSASSGQSASMDVSVYCP
jgi:hypothetical protein